MCKYPGCNVQCRNYWELAIHSRATHPSTIPTPEKKNYPSIKYGKNIYHFHKDLWLLKQDHELHKTTLKKKQSDKIIDSKGFSEGFLCPVPRCDRIFMNSSVYYTHVEIHNLVGWPKNDKQRCFPCDLCDKSYDNSKCKSACLALKTSLFSLGRSSPYETQSLLQRLHMSRTKLRSHFSIKGGT